MVEEVIINNKSYFKCEECGFVYEERDWSEKCEAWCKENHTCSLKITKHSVTP
ncbi:MAG: hypothetical protein K8R13_00095 [Methanococcoides sp.]|nr:hypothetical protein [Methanococcoides sp.]